MLPPEDSFKPLDYDYDYEYGEQGELGNAYSLDNYNPDNLDYLSENLSLMDVSKACVLPTLYDICITYFSVLLICLLFQCFNKFVQRRFVLKHILSCLMGIGILYSYVQHLIIHPIALAGMSFIIIYSAYAHNSPNYLSTVAVFLLISYLTLCEFICDGSSWARIRNVQMLIVMKVISLILDLRNGRIQLPTMTQYFGYIFCVGNSIFGPWIDYSTYLNLFKPKRWNSTFVLRILTSVLKSLLFFSASMCYLDWIWPETDESNALLMYFEALEFRTSHYFIMFMSESLSLAIGHDVSADSSNLSCTTKPSSIEFPRSLVQVVVFWNVPMHAWLKKYVFKPLSKYGRFVAVIGTFFFSSLLHGLNYQLSGILLSLAVYTYVEYVFRQKLARKFDACLLSKSCELNCKLHRRTERLIPVRLLNLGFTFLALYHLSYLGCLIDLRVERKLGFFESFQKWKDKDYSSHFVVLVTFGLNLLL